MPAKPLENTYIQGAHLDHEGRWKDYIYNGADDNGSGSVGVLNLARAFAANARKPKRTKNRSLSPGA